MRHWLAELYRRKGELLLVLPNYNVSEAEAWFQKAIDIAHQQGAKSLELRATMSLARLTQRHGKIREARNGLAAVYDRFTEGFDTVDLKEAKTLLEKLA